MTSAKPRCKCGSATTLNDTHPYSDRCPKCLIDKHGEIKYFTQLELQKQGYIVIAADNPDKTKKISREIRNNTPIEQITKPTNNVQDITPEKIYSQKKIPNNYLIDLSLGIKSSSRYIYTRITDEQTVIDERTFTPDKSLNHLRKKLLDEVIDSKYYSQITKKKDTKEITQYIYPTLSRHGVTRYLPSKLWSHVKKHNKSQLDEASNRASKNQTVGREFEDFFEELCKNKGLNPRNTPSNALHEKDPETYRFIIEKMGSTKGIPDFYVEVPDSKRIKNEKWQPEKDCFVEVKYGDSHLSKHQKRMIPYLKNQGYPVYVLRGSERNYRFDSR